MFVIDSNASVHGKRYSLYRKSCWITSNVKPAAVETTRNYQYHQEIDCFEVKGLKMNIHKEQRFYRWKVAYYDSFHVADQWNFSLIKMGPVSFGAALIAASKSLNGSLDVTFFELGHWTSCFSSWNTWTGFWIKRNYAAFRNLRRLEDALFKSSISFYRSAKHSSRNEKEGKGTRVFQDVRFWTHKPYWPLADHSSCNSKSKLKKTMQAPSSAKRT
jgi:hypothetical protein